MIVRGHGDAEVTASAVSVGRPWTDHRTLICRLPGALARPHAVTRVGAGYKARSPAQSPDMPR
jgi:hypothetical protein